MVIASSRISVSNTRNIQLQQNRLINQGGTLKARDFDIVQVVELGLSAPPYPFSCLCERQPHRTVHKECRACMSVCVCLLRCSVFVGLCEDVNKLQEARPGI